MEETIQKLLIPGKGILAADASTKTLSKRFTALGLTLTPELNKKYKEVLFTTPNFSDVVSGVILFDETIRQAFQGSFATQFLNNLGVVSGIKVDQGLENYNNTEEQVTLGLDGLGQRLEEYSKLGAKFTKWRAVIKISDIFPTEVFLLENLTRLAEYALISQQHDLLPIVEPEVLLDGNHTNARCEEVTTKTLKKLFEILEGKRVNLKTLLLKVNMVLPGKDSGVVAEPLEVGNATLRTIKNSVPNEVPGIVFLSGGQTPDQATTNLNEIVKLNKDKTFGNWDLSFSFDRALQQEALSTWRGLDENTASSQQVFNQRLLMVQKARKGEL